MKGSLRALCLIVATLSGGSDAMAMVDGGAWPVHQAVGSSLYSSRVSMSVGLDGVADNVAYEPHQEGGDFEPIQSRPRYVAGRIGLHWSPNPGLDIRAGFTSHTIRSKRDVFELDTWHLSLRQDIPVNLGAIDLSVGVSLGSNRTHALTKTSYTRYDDWLITQASLLDARDQQLQANLFAERYLGAQLHALTYIGIGQAVSENQGFDGIAQDQDQCRYSVSVNNERNLVRLAEPCGQIQALSQEFSSRESFENRYGFDTEADFTGQTQYWQAGVQLARNANQSNYGIGYHYQSFNRGEMDLRLQERGGKALTDNHSLSAWWHYRLASRWRIETGAEYSLRPMLNRLHVLYTGFTSERFNSSALIFNLTLRYQL